MKNRIVNMTTHTVDVLDKNKKVIISIKPSGGSIRLGKTVTQVTTLNCFNNKNNMNGIPITKTIYSSATLPKQEEGVFYIVSQMIKNSVNRNDLLVPTQIKRDNQGRILGCMSLGI